MAAPREPATNVVRPQRLNGRAPPPPHDLDAEASVLSALMLDPKRLGEVTPILSASDFYADANKRIFAAIVDVSQSGASVDVVSIAARLRSQEQLAALGGTPYLSQIVDATPAVAHVREHARLVRDKARLRALIATGQTFIAEAYTSTSVDALLGVAGEQIRALAAASLDLQLLDGLALSAPLPPIEHLVREIGLVGGGGAPHVVAGYAFSAKTVTAQSLAVSLAAGLPTWGAYVTTPRRVAHVDLEQGKRLTVRRYQRLARARDVDLESLGDALAVLIMPGWTLAPACADRWRGLMRGRDLLIVDSLRAAMPGVDENASEVRAGLDMLGSLSEETGCRALVLHHARKPTADGSSGRFSVRGSSSIVDAADSVYVFSAEKGEPVRVEHVKARSHGEPVEDFALVVSDIEEAGDPRAGLRVQLHGAELVQQLREERGAVAREERTARDAEAVRKVLRTRPGLGSRELRAATGLSGDRVTAALTRLGEDVELRDETNGRVRTTRHYLRGDR